MPQLLMVICSRPVRVKGISVEASLNDGEGGALLMGVVLIWT